MEKHSPDQEKRPCCAQVEVTAYGPAQPALELGLVWSGTSDWPTGSRPFATWGIDCRRCSRTRGSFSPVPGRLGPETPYDFLHSALAQGAV